MMGSEPVLAYGMVVVSGGVQTCSWASPVVHVILSAAASNTLGLEGEREMSTYAIRKQEHLRELAEMQAVLDAAEPESLPWEFRNRVLERVEQLPQGEQEHWKARYMDQLKKATEPLEEWHARQQRDQEEARERLEELAASFPDGGIGELCGRALQEAVTEQLMRLPGSEREVWLSVNGWAFRRAVGLEWQRG